MNTSIIQIVTTALAVLGAVLGALNAWRNWAHDRVKVNVMVNSGTSTLGEDGLMITVRNLSRFPITITTVGFRIHGTKRHLQMIDPFILEGKSLPIRLESRTSFTAFQTFSTLPTDSIPLLRQAYIKTACGLTIDS